MPFHVVDKSLESGIDFIEEEGSALIAITAVRVKTAKLKVERISLLLEAVALHHDAFDLLEC